MEYTRFTNIEAVGDVKGATGTFASITGNVTGNVTGATGTFSGAVSSAGFVGPVTGDVTGDVTGNVTGNVTGYALQSKTIAATATGAAIPVGVTHVAVTSDSADKIIVLPAPIPGLEITLINGATGYELRTSAPETIGINGGVGEDAESAIAANTTVVMRCVSATNWIGATYTSAGVVGVVQVAE